MVRGAVVLVVICACSIDDAGLSDSSAPDASDAIVGSDVGMADAMPDAPPPCNLALPFVTFGDLPNINSAALEAAPTLTSDELTMYFGRSTSGSNVAIFYASRSATSQPFGAVAQANTIAAGGSTSDTAPSVADGLMLMFFQSADYSTNYHVYQAIGTGAHDGWSHITPVPTNTVDAFADANPFWSAIASQLWFTSNRSALGYDIYVNIDDVAVSATSLNSPANEVRPVLSADALRIYFGRDDANHVFHVWTATRGATTAAFDPPSQVKDFDSAPNENNLPGWLSTDGCRMYFFSDRSGGKGSFDIWMATRAP